MAGYKWVTKRGHPNANGRGQLHEQVFVMSEMIGRALTAFEVVHHIDENPSNNHPDNLQLFATKAEHNTHHARQRALIASGNADFMKCPYCKVYDDPANMFVVAKVRKAYHNSCNTQYTRQSRAKRKLSTINLGI